MFESDPFEIQNLRTEIGRIALARQGHGRCRERLRRGIRPPRDPKTRPLWDYGHFSHQDPRVLYLLTLDPRRPSSFYSTGAHGFVHMSYREPFGEQRQQQTSIPTPERACYNDSSIQDPTHQDPVSPNSQDAALKKLEGALRKHTLCV